LAKKARTPAPPKRPVQAPKRRTQAPPRRPDDRRKLYLLFAFSGAGILALVAVIAVIVLAGGKGAGGSVNASGVANTMRAAGCTFRNTPGIQALSNHANVPNLALNVTFNGGRPVDKNGVHYWTYPPANGPHYGIPAVWNFYDQPVNVLQVVHNQEHGGVVLWWGPNVPQSEVEQLRTFYQSSPVSMVGTPAPRLGNKVGITAWTGNPAHYFQNGDYGTGHVAVCPRFDEHAFTVFRDAFRGHGPEGIPMSSNQPGT
jgi:hypothetical protein